MRKKRGQLTIFIIISTVLLFSIIFYFLYINNQTSQKNTLINQDVETIKDFVDICIEKTQDEVTYQLFENGGYFILPQESINNNIPYYFKEKDLIPSKEKIESELSEFFEMSLFLCTKNFIDYPDIEIEPGKINVQSKILEEAILFDIDFSIKISKDNEVKIIREFSSTRTGRFDLIYSLAKEIVQDYQEFEAICLNCILDSANENDLYVEFFDFENSYIFLITDYNSVINEKPIKFYFAIK